MKMSSISLLGALGNSFINVPVPNWKAGIFRSVTNRTGQKVRSLDGAGSVAVR